MAGNPLVVGTVYSDASLRAAVALAGKPGAPDLLELRIDHFAENPAKLETVTDSPPRLFIVTVRHPEEGGAGNLSDENRAQLFERFERHAAYIDIEVRSLETLREVVRRARDRKCGVVASFHDFAGMPSLAELHRQADRAVEAGAQVFKVAAMTQTAADLAVLLEFMASEQRVPLALMGMGALGRVSRLALASAGSVLNYGYLGETTQVSGQWPAALLRERIDELLGEQKPGDAAPALQKLLSAATRPPSSKQELPS